MKEFNFISDVDDAIVREFADFIQKVPDNDSVQLLIASHGGLVYLGLAVAQLIAQAQARGITVEANIFGIAASAAGDIALACDKIYMADGAQIMIHSAWGGSDEGIERANGEQLALIHKRLPDYTEKDLENDAWFSAERAVEIGLADGLINIKEVKANAIKVAASVSKLLMEDREMTNVKSKAAEEEVVERKIDEEEEKKEEVEAECGDDEEKADGEMDIMEAIVERLGKIEERLAVLEGEGKKADDEMAPSASTRRKALLAKLNAVCAPVQTSTAKVTTVQAETVEDRDARCKAVYKNFDALMADFIKRK